MEGLILIALEELIKLIKSLDSKIDLLVSLQTQKELNEQKMKDLVSDLKETISCD